jgi:hypothetical protein
MNEEYLGTRDLAKAVKNRCSIGIFTIAPPHIIALETLPANGPASALHTDIIEVAEENVLAEVINVDNALAY